MEQAIAAYGTIITGLLGANMVIQLFFIKKLIDHERRIATVETELCHVLMV